MVTVQDVEQREKEIDELEGELKEAERVASVVQKKKIPQRRFGAGVTKSQQQEVVQQRSEATSVVKRIPEARRNLQEARGELKEARVAIAENERREAEYQAALKRKRDYDYGYKLAMKGVLDPDMTKAAKEGYRDAMSVRRGQKALSDAGITPIYVKGELRGFEDAERKQSISAEAIKGLGIEDLKRYERAGVIGLTSPNAPTAREIALQMSLPESERFKLPQSYATTELKKNGNTVINSNRQRVVNAFGTAYSLVQNTASDIKKEIGIATKGFYRSRIETGYYTQAGVLGIIPLHGIKKPAVGRPDPKTDAELKRITGATYEQARSTEATLALSLLGGLTTKIAVGTSRKDFERLFQIGQPLSEDQKLPSGRQEDINQQIELFNKEVSKFESTYNNQIVGNEFVGSSESFVSYEKDFAKLQAKELALKEYEKEVREKPITTKEAYSTFGKAAVIGAGFGIVGKALKVSGASIGVGTGRISQVAGGAVEVYFKRELIKSGVDIAVYVRKNELELAKLSTLELGGGVAGFAAGGYVTQKGIYGAIDLKRTFGTRVLEQPSINTKPFVRSNEPGALVFMRRYEGFKPTKVETYRPAFLNLIGVKNYKKGQFLKRQYQITPPSVRAKLERRDSFPEYTLNSKGDIVFRQARAEPFPHDDPKNFAKLAYSKEYKLPGVPKELKGKATGYSATPEAFKQTKFDEQVLTELKKLSGNINVDSIKEVKLKGALQFFSLKGLSAYFLRIDKGGPKETSGVTGLPPIRPTTYVGYFDDIQVNKALGEVKGVAGGRELKAYIYSKPTREGIPAIGGFKREAEATVEFTERLPFSRGLSFNLLGRKVLIEQETFKVPDTTGIVKNSNIVKPSQIKSTYGELSSYLPSSRISPRVSAFSYTVDKSSSKSSILKSNLSSLIISSGKSSSTSNVSSKMSSRVVSKMSSPSQISRATSGRSSIVPERVNYRRSEYKPYVPKTPTLSPPKNKKRIVLPRIKGGLESYTSEGFKPFVIRGGEKVYLDIAPLPKGQALMAGEKEALKTLRATFGVEPINQLVAGRDISFTPKSKIFRDYRIRAGKKIPLKDTFIQRLGKRLSSRGEVSEIKMASRRKLK